VNKYRNKPTYVDRIRFDSKKEARRWQDLCLLQQAGEITGLVRQIRFPLCVNGVRVCTYVADFTYREKDGRDIVEDTKGVKTPVYRIKANLMWAIHRIEIRET
jgi:hypothetical protein